jgi:hypothetical protein
LNYLGYRDNQKLGTGGGYLVLSYFMGDLGALDLYVPSWDEAFLGGTGNDSAMGRRRGVFVLDPRREMLLGEYNFLVHSIPSISTNGFVYLARGIFSFRRLLEEP